ncbi:TPA: hypothetical protein N0F65_007357 [Lagenidium giganteum]|uniref:Uncharacterized protein n=1 Tax=Lagenidium giganteum TaxID=4803 RepID=A0AAV2YIG9_9STRA|nr:TPA: hypothetical protein N0F65_007357 [Lagenidium giganteum]
MHCLTFFTLLAVLSIADAAIPSDASFVYDGTSSDLVQQFYNLHVARTKVPTLGLASAQLPTAVTERLSDVAVEFDALPGLLQRALLWDSGYVVQRGSTSNLTAIRTACGAGATTGVTMAEIALTYADYVGAKCTLEPNCSVHRNHDCTGDQFGRGARCAATNVDVWSGEALWSTGGGPTLLPHPIIVRHEWDTPEGGHYRMYGIHARYLSNGGRQRGDHHPLRRARCEPQAVVSTGKGQAGGRAVG